MKNWRGWGWGWYILLHFIQKFPQAPFTSTSFSPSLAFFFFFLSPSLSSEPAQVLHAPCLSIRGSSPTCWTLEEEGGQPLELSGSEGDRLFPWLAGAWQPRSHPWVMPGRALCSEEGQAASAWSGLVWVKPQLKQPRFPGMSLAKDGRRSLTEHGAHCSRLHAEREMVICASVWCLHTRLPFGFPLLPSKM